MPKVIGYIVMDACDDFEQALWLDEGPGTPTGGVLNWRDGHPATVFSTRKDARRAIARTHHFAAAHEDLAQWPERKFCRVVPLVAAPAASAPGGA